MLLHMDFDGIELWLEREAGEREDVLGELRGDPFLKNNVGKLYRWKYV